MFGLIVAIPVACLAIGICLVAKKTRIEAGKLLISFAVLALMAIFGFLAAALIAFSSAGADFYIAALAIFLALSAGLILYLLWSAKRRRSVIAAVVCGVVLCAAATGGVYLYRTYIENIPTLEEGGDLLARYAPYAENSETAELDEESELKLSSDIPRMDGATALYPIYAAFAKAVYPKELIDDVGEAAVNEYLMCSTTTGAYRNIVTGDADIIFAAAPSDEQRDYAEENGVELVYTPIGKEAFVFFVNAQNPIENITVDEIRGIYGGEITEWEQLGARGMGEIRAFQRDEGSGSQSALIRLMQDKPLIEPPQADVIAGMGGIISKTADYKNYKNAIGFSFRFYSTEMVENNSIKLLSVDGVYPDIRNIESGAYPLTSEFYAVVRKDGSENVKLLLDWITGEQGRELIERAGYTPIARAAN